MCRNEQIRLTSYVDSLYGKKAVLSIFLLTILEVLSIVMETVNTCCDSDTGRATCRVISLGPGMLVIRGLNHPREKNPTEGDGMSQEFRKGKPS
jgi:hypothetical protein